MALQSLKINFTAALLFIFFLKTFSQIPTCKDSFPTSLLPNNSFEEHSACFTADFGGTEEGGGIDISLNYGGILVPGWHSVWKDRSIQYRNYSCRLYDSLSIFDSAIFCYVSAKVPMPLPDGLGFIEIYEDRAGQVPDEINSAKQYITTCLQQPLYAGITYTFSFYFGFSRPYKLICGDGPTPKQSLSPYGIGIFGRTDCPDYPGLLTDTIGGCLTHFPGWILLGHVLLSGQNQWVQGVIEFTPSVNIYNIAVGADCSNNYSISYYNELHYFMDKFVLAPKADFAFKTITAVSGNSCTGHFVLQAPAYGSSTYQWYKDGALIPAATSQTYTVPDKEDAAGNYIANVSLPYNNCLNTLPFTVAFSDLNKFSLGNDTTLCAPAEITLNANWQNAADYLWQDGSKNVTLQVNNSGLYWVQLTDNNGCSKRDSININIQGCDKCELFIPSAFTPNNDGLNDVFRAKPQCTNIALSNFKIRIYNRWGTLVFESNDINKGWDGSYKGHILKESVYIYIINYSYNQTETFQKKGTLVLL